MSWQVAFNTDNTINTFVPLQPVLIGPPVPGAQTIHEAHYHDLSLGSNSQYAGIGYVMQFQLPNENGNIMYTATMYFVISFARGNCLNVTVDPVSDLQQWHNNNVGNNQDTSTSATRVVDGGGWQIGCLVDHAWCLGCAWIGP